VKPPLDSRTRDEATYHFGAAFIALNHQQMRDADALEYFEEVRDPRRLNRLPVHGGQIFPLGHDVAHRDIFAPSP
jgi:hypothetical protein